jgi:glycosyltransferase involved in cell wall biosynthesis
MKPRITFFMQDLGPGGAQRHTVGLLCGLQNQFDFSVVIQEPVVDIGIVGHDAPFVINQPPADECSTSRSDRWMLACRRIATTNPDLVICINQVAMIVCMLGRWLGLIKSPVTTIFHSTQIGNLAGWLRTVPYIAAVRFGDGLFFISENQRRFWERRGLSSRQIWTILNGIDLSRLPDVGPDLRAQVRARYGLADSDLVIGCLAVFRYEKNHLQQIDALARLRTQGVSAKLLLVGDGPMRSQIEARISDTGMTEHVVLAGMQRDVSSFIFAMDIGWITSLSTETLSLAALESMALGVPMVMSDIGGASEIIEPGVNGHLFPAGDTEALVAAVSLLTEPDVRRRTADAARQTARDRFSSENMLRSYAGAFGQLTLTNTKP